MRKWKDYSVMERAIKECVEAHSLRNSQVFISSLAFLTLFIEGMLADCGCSFEQHFNIQLQPGTFKASISIEHLLVYRDGKCNVIAQYPPGICSKTVTGK